MKNKPILFITSLSSVVLAVLAVFGALSFLTVPAQAADKAQVENHYNAYFAAAKAVVDMNITKQIDPARVEQLVDTMVPHAIWIAQEYAKVRPKGEKVINLYIQNLDNIRKLSFKEIQADWHDLGIFAKPGHDVGLDMKAEENEHFTDPLHAMIQPFMVLRAAKDYAAQSQG